MQIYPRPLIFRMMQDHLFDMINDGQPFGMMFISGLPSHFGMRGDDLHFGMHTDLSQIALQIYRQSHFGMMGMIIILEWHLDLF